MKKGLIIIALLAVSAVVALPLACIEINSERESIYIEEEVISGSPIEAAGVTITLNTILDDHMLWDTSYTIGSGNDAVSEFTFEANGVSYEREISGYFNAYTVTDFGTAYASDGSRFTVDISEINLSKIIGAVADMCQPNEEITKVVNFADYYDYYPISCSMRDDDLDVSFYDDENEAFTELLSIGVNENHRLEVTVKKNNWDEVIYVKCQDAEGFGMGYYMVETYAFGEFGCYYVFECRDDNGKVASLGQNSGVFYVPYEDEDYRTTINVKGIKKVCELPEGTFPVELLLDEKENALYMLVTDYNEYSLLVYELDGIVPVMTQQISIAKEEEAHFSEMTFEDGGILIKWYDGSFAFVSTLEDKPRLWCSDEFARGSEYVLSNFPSEHKCVFDGERLVLAAIDARDGMDVVISVYSENGMEYCGIYSYIGKQEFRSLGISR